ncbi:MAG: glycosyltransferase [Bacteroidota bacterium]
MVIFLFIVVGLCVYGMLHSYLVYPWWTISRSRNNIRLQRDEVTYLKHYYPPSLLNNQVNKVANPWTAPSIKKLLSDRFIHPTELSLGSANPFASNRWKELPALPRVIVLMAVHNEEVVLEKKLNSLLAQDYPGSYQIYVGSDCSTDGTNGILRAYKERYPYQITVQEFASRQGKPSIINQLAEKARPWTKEKIFLLTDASVMLQPNAVSELVKPMIRYPELAVADARMIHTGMQVEGIGQAEDLYIGQEVALKQAEGHLWGYMIGPFGGCYALRANYFVPVPDTYLVDDFFLCLSAYERGGRGISVPTAHCTEAVGQEIADEFRRKVRISSGNWQNATRFKSSWWPIRNSLSYAFFSHKILRWLTPMLLLILLLCLGVLAFLLDNYWAQLAFFSLSCLLTIPPLLDIILSKWCGVNWFPLRSIRYFLAMNLALLVGFFRYLKGIQSNVWQPSKRH